MSLLLIALTVALCLIPILVALASARKRAAIDGQHAMSVLEYMATSTLVSVLPATSFYRDRLGHYGNGEKQQDLQERARRAWRQAGILFIPELVGVLGSFYVSSVALTPGRSVLVLSAIIATAMFGAALAARKPSDLILPQDWFAFFKDGLLWPATLPAVAKAINLTTGTG